MLDRATVDHIAELARLGLTDAERETLRTQLAAILDYVNQLAALDVDAGAGGAGRAGPASLRLREDTVFASLPREAVLANAPDVETGQFRVPRLLD